MIKVGVTGGIGSGKTVVCNVFQSLGAYVLNADDLAKHLMVNDAEIRQQIIETFGEQSYRADGSLNREFLAEQAFEKDRVEELNNIVHPHIPPETEKIMQKVEKEGFDVFVYEAALLLQNLRPDYLDYIVLVLADKNKRVKRVQQRDNVAEELVRNRMNKQQDFDRLTHLADMVIENNGSLEDLKSKTRRIYRFFLQSSEH